MALVAATASVKDLPSTLSRVADGAFVAGNEVIKRRIKRHQGSLVGCDGSHQICAVGRMVEDALEIFPVFLCRGDPGNSGIDVWLTHLARIDNRQSSLLVQTICTSVPKLCFVIERVQDGRGVALTDASMDSNRRRPPVGECTRRVMTGAASDSAIG